MRRAFMYRLLMVWMTGRANSYRPGMNRPNRMPSISPMKIARVMFRDFFFFMLDPPYNIKHPSSNSIEDGRHCPWYHFSSLPDGGLIDGCPAASSAVTGRPVAA